MKAHAQLSILIFLNSLRCGEVLVVMSFLMNSVDNDYGRIEILVSVDSLVAFWFIFFERRAHFLCLTLRFRFLSWFERGSEDNPINKEKRNTEKTSAA